MVDGRGPDNIGRDVARSSDRAVTLPDLVANHTLDWRTAALLWLALERHCSLIVAAAPRLAGKTTTLEALCDLVFPLYTFVETRGVDEDFSILQETEPQQTYIMVNELSDHLPRYLWGSAAVTLFQELERGYAFTATMHTDAAAGVITELMDSSLTLPARAVARLDLVVMLRLFLDGAEPVRRLVSVDVVAFAEDGVTELTTEPLVTWDPQTDTLEPSDAETGRSLLERRLHLTWPEIQEEVERRQALLPALAANGGSSVERMRQAAQAYYRQQRGGR